MPPADTCATSASVAHSRSRTWSAWSGASIRGACTSTTATRSFSLACRCTSSAATPWVCRRCASPRAAAGSCSLPTRAISTPTWSRSGRFPSSGRSRKWSTATGACARSPTRRSTSFPGTILWCSSDIRRRQRRCRVSSRGSTSTGPPVSFDFDVPVDRAGTWSLRWDRHAGEDVIPLWVADSDFRAPPQVLHALNARVEHGILGYTLPPDELRKAIVERLRSRYGWAVEPSWIVFLPGVVPGLHIAARRLIAPDERVLVPTPVYQHFKRAVELAPRPHSDV